MEKKQISFNKFYKFFNILSISLIIISVSLLLFKGLNYGVDFKGGTLIELRANDTQITISKLRQSLMNINLGDVSVKQFGNKNDYLIQFEKKDKVLKPIYNILQLCNILHFRCINLLIFYII